MSRDDLTQFSYVILALVGPGGAGPHDLVQMARRGRIYWDAADSQWYAEPKRLERLGYLSSRREPGRTRERTHYELTNQGLEVLRSWAALPTPFPRYRNEGVIRLLAADLVGEEAPLQSIVALREELAGLAAQLDQAETVAHTIPHREKYLLLNHRLARRLLAAHQEWIDEVERELS